MKTVLTHILYLVIVWAIVTLTLARWFNPVYAGFVQPHVGTGFAASNHLAHIPPLNAVFLCVPFGYAAFMVWLDGEAFAPASLLSDLSANPIQPNRLKFAVNGSASINHLGAHNHA